MPLKYPDDFINKVIPGDCLEVMKQMPDKCVDLVLTDPPYGVNLDYDMHDDNEAGWYKLMDKWIPEARRISKMVIFPSCQIKRLDWYYKNHKPDWLICWYKGSTGHVSTIGFNDWEPHIVYGKIKMMHDYFQARPDEKMGAYGHPCPKPIEWAKWLIGKSTDEQMVVMDTFLGSGTTAVAAKQLGRKYIGIELSQKYCEIANERLKQDLLF